MTSVAGLSGLGVTAGLIGCCLFVRGRGESRPLEAVRGVGPPGRRLLRGRRAGRAATDGGLSMAAVTAYGRVSLAL